MRDCLFANPSVHGTARNADKGAGARTEACYAIRPSVGGLSGGTRRLLDILVGMLSIRYSDSVEEISMHGEIVFADGDNLWEKPASDTLLATARLTVPAGMDGPVSRHQETVQVRFPDEAEVPAPFRGRLLRTSMHAS